MINNNPLSPASIAAQEFISTLQPKQRAMLYNSLLNNMAITQCSLNEHLTDVNNRLRPPLHNRITVFYRWSISEQHDLIKSCLEKTQT